MALVRYLTAATLARSADSGAAVGFVLLAETTPGQSRPALTGALLVTGLTAPHLLGPILGRHLDRSEDGRRLIAAVCAGFGTLVALVAVLFGRAPLFLLVLLTVVAGLGGPLLTGGLSSRLGALVAAGQHAQRRAQGLDSLSYGISGTAGPAAVAALAALAGARPAVVGLGLTTLAAAVLILTLPYGENEVQADQVLSVGSTLRLIARTGPLRRVMYTMAAAAFPNGAIAVLAVALAGDLHVTAGTAGLLTAAFGLGYLAGSLTMIAWPLPGEPEKLVTITVSLVAAGFVGCALAPTYPLAVVAFTVLGALNAPLFTATLASRAQYSPPEARAQVFVSMAALKVAAASAGTAAVGAAMGLGPRVLMLIGAILILATAVITVLDRRRPPQKAAPYSVLNSGDTKPV
jgi:MFS family permease